MSEDDICRDFLRRACNRGSRCKFRHPESSENVHEFCKDFQMSYCHRSNCKFVHASVEAEAYYKDTGRLPRSLDMRESPEREQESSVRQVDNDIPLCKDFLSGQCKRGMKCKYRHRSIGDIEYEDRRQRSNSQQDGRKSRRDSPRESSRRNSPRESSRRNSPRELSPLDEYSHDYSRRRIAPELVSYPSRHSRYDDLPRNDYATRNRTIREYEEENHKLHRKVEDLRKLVEDLTSTNDILLEQNARLRAIKNDVSAVLLAESHLIRSTPTVTPAQVHLTAATAGVVPYPARVAAAAPTAAHVAAANSTAQVITAELQGLPVSMASAAGIPTASLPSAMTPQVPTLSSIPPSVCVTSSLMTYPLTTLCNMSNVATVTVPNVATVNVANVPTPNRLGP